MKDLIEKKVMILYLLENQDDSVEELVDLGQVEDVNPIEQITTVGLSVGLVTEKSLPGPRVALFGGEERKRN